MTSKGTANTGQSALGAEQQSGAQVGRSTPPRLPAALANLARFRPLQSARLLIAAAEGAPIPTREWAAHVDAAYAGRNVREAAAWPVAALRDVGPARQKELAALGVKTVADLSVLDRRIATALREQAGVENGFSEPPSAPAELLPGMAGAIASTTRMASFIREQDLRHLRYAIGPECAAGIAFDPDEKNPRGLADIFTQQSCPATYVGYVARHTQRWINLGTHLGEVAHSLSLAPGESRNLALVDWRRRSRAARTEETATAERVVSEQFHQRALDEVARAVAEEHQYGKTRTEASTSAMAGSFVVAGAVVGGVAGGVTGAIIGTVVAPGEGTAIGAAVGSVAGAAAGVAAGGLVYSGAHTLGLIEASSAGDRDVVGEVHQNILQSVSQKSSAARSLYSTIVVEYAEGETVVAGTSNVTNYNHMHALNIEYYEVLQHYLTTLDFERAEPVLYVPFGALNFLAVRGDQGALAYVRDYWDPIREHLDPLLQAQGDLYMVEDSVPAGPTLQPLPPLPIAPTDPAMLVITELEIWVLFKATPFTNIGLQVRSGGSVLQYAETAHEDDASPVAGWPFGTWFSFAAGTALAAQEVTGIAVSCNQLAPLSSDLSFSVVIKKGKLGNGSAQEDLAGRILASAASIPRAVADPVVVVPWDPDAGLEVEWNAYRHSKDNYDRIVARNQLQQAAWEALVAGEERFRANLQRTLQRRRHFFTRVILSAVEPEQITHLLEALNIESAEGGENFVFPLRLVAHTIPIGMTNSSYLLRLKPWPAVLSGMVGSFGGATHGTAPGTAGAAIEAGLTDHKDALSLLIYARELASWYAEASKRDEFHASEHVYLPTGGLFAEAVLGRSNAAEVLDMTRYFNWQDSPIPHQAPPVTPPGTESRYQAPSGLTPTTPPSTINLVGPASFPDPTGLKEVLTAVRTGDMFRDMSKADQLATIVSGLATLAGKMGEVSAQLTGDAAKQALQSATEIGKVVSQLSSGLAQQGLQQLGGAPKTLTEKGATLKELEKHFTGGVPDHDFGATLGLPPDVVPEASPPPSDGGASGSGGGGASDAGTGAGGASGSGAAPALPAITQPGQIHDIEPSEEAWQQVAEPWAQKFVDLTTGPGGVPLQPTTQALVTHGVEMFEAVVLPGLQQAASDDRLLAQATHQWLQWKAHTQTAGIAGEADIVAADTQAQIWAVGGLRNAIQLAADRAVASNDWRYLLDALEWSAAAQHLGVADPANRLHHGYVIADFPLRVEIVPLSLPAALAAGETATLTLQAGLRIADNPPLHDEPLQWQMSVVGGSASGPGYGETSALGGFAASVARDSTADLSITVKVAFVWDSTTLYQAEWSHAVPLPA